MMKASPTLFIKLIIGLIGSGAIIILAWFPLVEGRAANLDLLSIYTDPLIVYAYLSSIPFFGALYQVYKLLNYVDDNKIFSQAAVKAMGTIKLNAMITSGLILLGLLFIRLYVRDEDTAGVTGLGIIAALATTVIAAAADVFEKQLQIAVNLKAENDLTV